jgi:hypothetical protein
MMKNSVLLLLMEVEHFLLLSKEMKELFSKKFLLNFLKNMEEEVNQQTDLQDLEKKRDTTMLPK